MTATFRSSVAREFFALYSELATAVGGLPRKVDLSPERLISCLGHIFIAEATPAGIYFRLFGTKIRELTGREMTSRFLGEGLSGADLDHVEALHRRCLGEQRAIATVERLTYPVNVAIEVEILRTPWADEHGVPRFVCGTFSAVGEKQWLPETERSWELGIERNSRQPIEIPIGAGATA